MKTRSFCVKTAHRGVLRGSRTCVIWPRASIRKLFMKRSSSTGSRFDNKSALTGWGVNIDTIRCICWYYRPGEEIEPGMGGERLNEDLACWNGD